MAVLVAGVVPAVALNYFVLQGLTRDGTRALDFLLHLIPLAMGALAAGAWRGRRPRAWATLGVLAGVIEALVMLAIFSDAGRRLLDSQFGAHTVPALEDYLAIPATIALFIFGALLVDRRKPEPTTRRPAAAANTPVSASRDGGRTTGMTAVLCHPATVPLLGALGLACQVYSTLGGKGLPSG